MDLAECWLFFNYSREILRYVIASWGDM